MYTKVYIYICISRRSCICRGDGGNPKPVTNSILGTKILGTKIVPVRKKNAPFSKNDEFPTPPHPETRNS